MNETITAPAAIEPSKSVATFNDALRYAAEMSRTHTLFASRQWQDRFKQYRPRTIEGKLLGFSKKAAQDCLRLQPGGTWNVLAEPVVSAVNGTGTATSITTPGHRLSLWYSRYLPYAHAMMLAEDSYRAFGIDFESINIYYHTCLGFSYLTEGNGVDPTDVELYQNLASATWKHWPSTLPFDEVYRPAIAFVAAQRPELVAARMDRPYISKEWRLTVLEKVTAIFETAGLPVDAFRKAMTPLTK